MTSRPLDILLLIIDAVGPETTSHATLSACALTCRAMRRRSQVLLFNTVELSTAKQCELFAATIHEIPEHGRLVKRMTIDCPEGWARDELKDHPLPPHVVARLTSLKSVKLIGFLNIFDGGNGPDPDIVLSFIKTFGSLATLTELTLCSITFEHPSDMFRLVWSFPYIQTLFLHHCGLEPYHDEEPEEFRLPAAKHYPGRCQALTSLKMHTMLPLDIVLAPIWGELITSLSIQQYYTIGLVHSYAGLAHFTRLRSLDLWFVPSSVYELPSILSYVHALGLEELTINVCIYGDATKAESEVLAFTLGKGLTTWTRLRKVVWVMRYPESEYDLDQCEAVAREVEAKVPAPSLRSIFSCRGIRPSMLFEQDRTVQYDARQSQGTHSGSNLSAPSLLLILVEPGPAIPEAKFNDWADNEHIPLRRMAIPTFLSCTRWVSAYDRKPVQLDPWSDVQ
ncbi:hypothetical protein L226DRAFT_569979 [Lentinus tigrinus ALCF2SS1-7]|uniref:F-box domain-containing protein n=1 Tax=Lentinus tigrinus ALCF2SS1-6 TaxID=1328759 RepID=A0A5C2SBI6_9APHY|nr:hypothetical protein L227DRAFT_611026 [Lentinus tigrinus ALCF2SS1-6]RPD75722.1 hypothetical protein L226DRAFT_569979 [Lentinus tigrinus ALCF2SS1-7]